MDNFFVTISPIKLIIYDLNKDLYIYKQIPYIQIKIKQHNIRIMSHECFFNTREFITRLEFDLNVITIVL